MLNVRPDEKQNRQTVMKEDQKGKFIVKRNYARA